MQCAVDPLAHDGPNLEANLVAAEHGLASGFMPMPLAAGTGPATLAGNLVVQNAEALSGVVLLELAYPGVPAFFAGAPSVIDLKTGGYTGGSPEDYLLAGASTQLAHFYGVPMAMGTMATGAKEPDWQAAIDDSLSTFASVMTNADMMNGAGLLNGSKILSYPHMVMETEIYGIVQKVANGIVVDDETLALDVIKKVGHNGTYLAEKHTRQHMKEIWRPTVWDRTPYDNWLREGKKGALEKATEIADDILANYQPEALSEDVVNELRAIVARADAELAGSLMPAARLTVWDDAACWRVHEATLALLEETGVEVRHAGAREQLADAGARVEGTRARIPAALVDAALQSAPRHFKLRERGASGGEGHARRGELGGLELEDGKSYFGTGSDCVYVTDPDTGERRQSTTADVEGMAALAEKLPNLDFVMSMGLPNDVAAEIGDLAQFAAMLAGTRKPLLTTAHDAVSLRRMKDMAAVCGEARSFACYAMPNPPLVHSSEALDKVRACAELDIPLVYAPAPAAGTTAPASMTATIVIGNAETLSGLVVHQLTRGGAPFVYGVGCGAFDMRTAVDVYGAPEHFLGNAAATDLARFYGLPSFAYAAVADAKTFDEQWAAEAGITAVLGALSRATLLHDVGYLESGLAEQLRHDRPRRRAGGLRARAARRGRRRR